MAYNGEDIEFLFGPAEPLSPRPRRRNGRTGGRRRNLMGKLVWLASYPKSGNTWVRAFLHNYIRDTETPHSINSLIAFSLTECAMAFFGKPGDVRWHRKGCRRPARAGMRH